METEGKYGTGTVVVAVLGGAVVGAAVALLLAPKAGRETRDQIAGYVDTAKETIGRVPDALKAASQAAREALVDEPEPAHHSVRHHEKS